MGKSIANKQLTLQKRRWSTRHQSRHDCMCSHSKPLVTIVAFVGAVVNDRISGEPPHRNRADTGRRTMPCGGAVPQQRWHAEHKTRVLTNNQWAYRLQTNKPLTMQKRCWICRQQSWQYCICSRSRSSFTIVPLVGAAFNSRIHGALTHSSNVETGRKKPRRQAEPNQRCHAEYNAHIVETNKQWTHCLQTNNVLYKSGVKMAAANRGIAAFVHAARHWLSLFH